MRLFALIALYLCGVINGIAIGMSFPAHVGILSHVAAYEIGKHNCECPAPPHPAQGKEE